MDIRQLRYFVAIVEERKISAAAQKLHLSQPPLSQQLKSIEEELGVKLVERAGKFLEVTEAGKTLYNYALKMLHLLEEAKVEVTEVGNGVKGRLTIGVNTLSVQGLPELLQQFHKKYPLVTYKIQQNESAQLCQLVRDRVIELAIIRMPLNLEDFTVVHLQSEPFYFITSNKQKISKQEFTFFDLQNYPLILPSTEGLGVYQLILAAFSTNQITPNILAECSDISILLDLVAADFGASIIPETVLKRYKPENILSYQLPKSHLSAATSIIWLKDHYLSNTAQNFLNQLTNKMEYDFE